MGYVPNYLGVFAYRPDVYAAWRQLLVAITANVDERRYELATVAAASRLRSSYCTLAHGKVLADRFLDPMVVKDVVLAAAAGCFFSKTLDALCVDPDSVFAGLEPELRDSLTVGRPISSE